MQLQISEKIILSPSLFLSLSHSLTQHIVYFSMGYVHLAPDYNVCGFFVSYLCYSIYYKLNKSFLSVLEYNMFCMKSKLRMFL